MKKFQLILVMLAIVVVIAGGIVLNTDIAMASPECGAPCSYNSCPAVCTTCAVQSWCCNGYWWERCAENDPLCSRSYCVH